jgi:hypothetical protein
MHIGRFLKLRLLVLIRNGHIQSAMLEFIAKVNPLLIHFCILKDRDQTEGEEFILLV